MQIYVYIFLGKADEDPFPNNDHSHILLRDVEMIVRFDSFESVDFIRYILLLTTLFVFNF